jgi:hypothetical protein
MFNNFNSDLNTKDKFSRCVGQMDHLVWWDEETVVTYHTENSHAIRITLIVSYVVKQYLKLDKLHILR